MAGLKVFMAVVVALIMEDGRGAHSCTLRNHKTGTSSRPWSPPVPNVPDLTQQQLLGLEQLLLKLHDTQTAAASTSAVATAAPPVTGYPTAVALPQPTFDNDPAHLKLLLAHLLSGPTELLGPNPTALEQRPTDPRPSTPPPSPVGLGVDPTPGPGTDSTPGLGTAAVAKGPAPDSTPGPVPDSTLGLVPDSTPGPVPDSMPGPVPDSTPGPVPDSTSGLGAESTPGLGVDSTTALPRPN